MSATLPEFVGTAEAARAANVSIKTIIRWATVQKRLRPVGKMPGLRGAYIFRGSDVEALVKTDGRTS